MIPQVLPRAIETLDGVDGNDIHALDLDDWTLNGTASQINVGALRLTGSATNEAGSAFTSNALPFGADYSFNAQFQVDVHNPGGLADGDGAGANGQDVYTCDGAPPQHVATSGDCDDSDSGVIIPIWWRDTDGDGAGAGVTVAQCNEG